MAFHHFCTCEGKVTNITTGVRNEVTIHLIDLDNFVTDEAWFVPRNGEWEENREGQKNRDRMSDEEIHVHKLALNYKMFHLPAGFCVFVSDLLIREVLFALSAGGMYI